MSQSENTAVDSTPVDCGDRGQQGAHAAAAAAGSERPNRLMDGRVRTVVGAYTPVETAEFYRVSQKSNGP